MIYKGFQDKKLSNLGFGTMRLPLNADGSIDQPQLDAMVDLAIASGVNYFDTAYPYHGGASETAIAKSLHRYPRDSWYLADKYPGHQITECYDPKAIFEDQLKKCGVDYFDFYLLHNVWEGSLDVYLDPKWGIMDYFLEQKRLGKIHHLGFSTHGRPEMIRSFLDRYGSEMEFCQIQLNYLDWTLQQAKEKYDLLTQRGIPVWVMEPVRGGKLAKLPDAEEEKLRALRPNASTASWGFRFLQDLPNVTMILSGMSELAQMEDNLKTFAAPAPLTRQETDLLLELAEGMKNAIPCTACRYCCDGCPVGLDIPTLLSVCSDLRFSHSLITAMAVQALPEEKQPSACLACGKCQKICPQGIHIPSIMEELTQRLSTIPNWADVCRQREEEQKKHRT